MKNNKKILGGILCILIIFLTQFILKASEVTVFSTQIAVAAIWGGVTLFAIYMLSNKDKFFGFKLTLISTILMLIMCLLTSVDFILSESIPQIVKTHRLLAIGMDILAGSSILVFVIFLAIASSITSKKNKS
jgi:hypothetical protein